MAAIARRPQAVLDAVLEVEPALAPALPARVRRPARSDEAPAVFEDVIDADVELDREPETAGRRARAGWLTGAALLGALSAYPAMVVAASQIGDGSAAIEVDRADWTAPWAGAVVAILDQQRDLGWANDAPDWSPMSVLTAKPAYQGALADALGEFLMMKAGPGGSGDPARGDLAAAARLVDAESTGVQLRAASDALHSFDARIERRGGLPEDTTSSTLKVVSLATGWAAVSKAELARSTERADGNPFGGGAIEAVYAAKGRALAAQAALSTTAWPEEAEVRSARNAALAAWEAAADFHPMFVLNAAPESTLLGNHPTAMGYLVDRAEAATQTYAEAIRSADARTGY